MPCSMRAGASSRSPEEDPSAASGHDLYGPLFPTLSGGVLRAAPAGRKDNRSATSAARTPLITSTTARVASAPPEIQNKALRVDGTRPASDANRSHRRLSFSVASI